MASLGLKFLSFVPVGVRPKDAKRIDKQHFEQMVDLPDVKQQRTWTTAHAAAYPTGPTGRPRRHPCDDPGCGALHFGLCRFRDTDIIADVAAWVERLHHVVEATDTATSLARLRFESVDADVVLVVWLGSVAERPRSQVYVLLRLLYDHNTELLPPPHLIDESFVYSMDCPLMEP